MKCMRWAWALSLLFATSASAQTTTTRTDQLSASTRIVVGDTNFDQVLKVVGLPSVSGGASSAIGIDSSGNVRKDSGTTISTGGLWTFGSKATFNGNVRTTAGLISGASVPISLLGIDTNGDVIKDTGVGADVSGHWSFGNWLYTPTVFATGTALDLAQGIDNVRLTQGSGGTGPRIILEDTGFPQWGITNASGHLQVYRTDSAGTVDETPLDLSEYVQFDPKAKALLPANPYDINIGSPIKKFLAIYAAELNVETLVRQSIMATMGGRILVLPTAALLSDITSTQTTIPLTTNNFASGDRGYMEGDGRVEFLAFTSGATLINLCPQSGSCATADTSTSWSVSSGSITVDRDHRWQGDASLSAPNTTTFIGYNDGTSFLTNSVTYTVQAVLRRSDDGVITPGANYKVFCGATDAATTTIADDLGTNGLGHHWYRLHGSCMHTSGTGWASVTLLPTGGVTHNIDAVQIEVGTTMTPWSQTAATYTVTRNLDGSGGNSWVAGTAVANTGQTGNGFIDLYSTRGVKAGTEVGPTIAFNKRNSSTYNDWSTCAAIGQLNGLYGYGSSTFGAGFGCGTSATWLSIDPTNGLRIMNGATTKLQATAVGHLSIAEGGVIIDNLGIRINNTTGTANESLAYTFTGLTSHTKRPGLFYFDNGTGSEMDLYTDTGIMQIQSSTGKLHLEGTSNSSSLDLDTNMTVGTTGNLALSVTGNVTINSTTAGDSGGAVTCPTGQAVKSFNVKKGIVISLTCSTP